MKYDKNSEIVGVDSAMRCGNNALHVYYQSLLYKVKGKLIIICSAEAAGLEENKSGNRCQCVISSELDVKLGSDSQILRNSPKKEFEKFLEKRKK
jgi:hypothetical protein